MQELSTHKTQPSLATIPLVLALLTGCALDYDHAHTHGEHHNFGQLQSALYGEVTFADDCSPEQEHVLREAMHRGRIASQTNAFEQCVRERVETLYTPCAGDPLFHASIATKTRRVLDKTQTENDLHINCTGGHSNASTYYHDFRYEQTERFWFSEWLDLMVGSLEAGVCGQPGADPSWCRAPGDPWAQLAGTTWHEVSHAHGYRHDACGIDDPNWHFQVNTIPYIVGDCMSEVISESARVCGVDRACGQAGFMMLDSLDDETCSCALDPNDDWDGRGSFGHARNSFNGTLDHANLDKTGHYMLGVADVDGDGYDDLVSAHQDGNAYVWPGHATGVFGGTVASFGGSLDIANVDGRGHYIVGLADVNGDGRADLVSAHDNGNAYVWPGRQDLTFGHVRSSFNGTLNVGNIDGTGHHIVGLADVTGDGRADLISAHNHGSVYVWPGRQDGTFGGAQSSFNGSMDAANFDGEGHFIIGVADVNGDGKADLVSTRDDGYGYVWPGRADGTFGHAEPSFGGTMNTANLDGDGHYLLAVKDVTGDGRADLVGAHEDGYAYVWPGRADLTFGHVVLSFDGTLNMANQDDEGHYLIGLGDVTGDGRADLISAHNNGHAYVWPAR